MATGLWNIGGFNLPDFGISERLGLSNIGIPNNANVNSGSNALNYNNQPVKTNVNVLGQTTKAIGPSSPGYFPGTANQVQQPTANNATNYTPPSRLQELSNISREGGLNPSQRSEYEVLMNAANAAARGNTDAELQSLNTQYDQTAESLNNQLGYLDTQRKNSLSSLELGLQGVQKQVGRSKENEQMNYERNVSEGLSTAQDVQKKNRNVLRALGILNSTAGGEILSKPFNEFDKQKASLSQALTQRMGELDDFVNQKTDEHRMAVQQLQSQYTNLVGQIQSDLRFNDRQRKDAIRSATAALQSRLADIQTAQFNYAAQAEAQNKQMALQLAQLGQYNAPSMSLSGIQQVGAAPTTQTASIYQGDVDPITGKKRTQ